MFFSPKNGGSVFVQDISWLSPLSPHVILENRILWNYCQNNSVIATDWMARVWFPVWARYFSSPQCPDWVWDPLSLLSSGYHGHFLLEWSGRGVKLTTQFHIILRLRMVELYLHSAICLHGVVLKHRDNFILLYFITTGVRTANCTLWCSHDLQCMFNVILFLLLLQRNGSNHWVTTGIRNV
jgi:hypothetical protein